MESGPPPQQPPWPPPEAPPGAGVSQGPPYYPPPPAAGWAQPPAMYGGLELAGWGSRAGAFVLDGLVLSALLIAVLAPGIVVAATASRVAGGLAFGIGALADIVLTILYAPFFMQREGERNGQTLGKQWVGIRVVRVSGEPLGWGWSLLRQFVLQGLALSVASSLAGALTFFLLGIGGIAPYLANYLWPLWDDQNRAVHDMIAETRVIRA